METSTLTRIPLLPSVFALSVIGLCYVGGSRLAGNNVVGLSSDYQSNDPRPNARESFVTETRPDGIQVTKQVAVINGQRVDHGKFESTYENGQRRSTGQNRAGKRDGDWSFWNRAGKLISQQTYVAGKLHGPYSVFHPDGKKAAVGETNRGEKHGAWTYFGAAGNRAQHGRFDNGMPVGTWTQTDAAGNVVDTVVYRDLTAASANH